MPFLREGGTYNGSTSNMQKYQLKQGDEDSLSRRGISQLGSSMRTPLSPRAPKKIYTSTGDNSINVLHSLRQFKKTILNEKRRNEMLRDISQKQSKAKAREASDLESHLSGMEYLDS